MGIRVEIGGYVFESAEYSVTEDATPLAAGDSMAGVSVIQLTVPRPDPNLPLDSQRTGAWFLRKFGAEPLRDKEVKLTDSRRGFMLGSVDAVQVDDASNTIRITCLSRMGALASNNISADPYSGSLGGAFAYYLSLAGITDIDSFRADPAISGRQVAYIGWQGELWQHLKMMAAAEDCEVTLVSGIIILRPIRTRIVSAGRTVSRARRSSVEQTAQAIEVYSYNTAPVTNGLVYPAGGPNIDEEILTVPGSGTAEYVIDLGASVTSIIQPIPVDTMDRYATNQSAYMVVDDAGNKIAASSWTKMGGSLEVEINPDTTSATVRIKGAAMANKEQMPIPTFSIAMGGHLEPMSSLRILGTGVLFNPVKQTVRTGNTLVESATDVGVTVDNPFVRNPDIAARIGLRAARRFARMSPTTSGELVSISRRGDTGSVTMPTYAEVNQEVRTAVGSSTPTWAQAAAYYQSLGLSTLGEVQEYYRQREAEQFDEQVFGNAQGARYWDAETRRWYRVRSATITPSTISFEADEDLTVEDMQELYSGMTYAQVQALFQGMTYREAGRLGMYNG